MRLRLGEADITAWRGGGTRGNLGGKLGWAQLGAILQSKTKIMSTFIASKSANNSVVRILRFPKIKSEL